MLTIRPFEQADAPRCSWIMYDAFKRIADEHEAIPDFVSPDVALRIARAFADDSAVFGVVAESNGEIIGSNFLLERDRVKTIGPTSVDPAFQDHGAGRALMNAVVKRAHGAESVRLVQDAFNMRSLSLYASLGFELKEPLVQMSGRATAPSLSDGLSVRAMEPDDAEECNALCERVHGFDRANELDEALILHEPFVAERDGRIVGYMSAANNRLANHAVAETSEDLQGLIAGVSAPRDEELLFLLPARDTALFTWCLQNGFRARKCSSLMVIGTYRDPQGAYFPSPHY